MEENIGFVSLASAGTMGHWSMVEKISKDLLDIIDGRIYVFSEYEYEKYSEVDSDKLEFVKLPKEDVKNTVAGSFKYKNKDFLIREIQKRDISHLFFSTFFDKRIINSVDMNKFLVTYPIRDSYLKLFYGKEFQKNFDRVLVLNDISPLPFTGVFKNTEIIEPILYNKRQEKSKRDQILVTMGGGGLPSTDIFSKMVSKSIRNLANKYEDIKFKILSGAFNSNSFEGLPHTEVTNWVNDMQAEYNRSKFVISESGFWTVHELLENQLPGILIPGKRKIDNQELRAVNWELKGLGNFVLPNTREGRLEKLIEKMYTDQGELKGCISKNAQEILERRINKKNIIDWIGERIK